MFARFLVLALAWLIFAAPGWAQVTARNVVVLDSKSVVAPLTLDFTTNTAGYFGSHTYPAALPGWSFSRASPGFAERRDGTLVAFASGQPRITDRGLLIEEARTNLVAYSSNATQTYWGKTNVTAALVEDPVMGTVSRITMPVVDSQAILTRSSVAASGTTVTRSVYVKPFGGASVISLRSTGTSTSPYAAVNFTFATEYLSLAGDTAAISASGFQKLPGGWYRLWFTMPATVDGATLGFALRQTSSSIDPPGSGYDFVHAQCEVGMFPTSPIVTAGAAATRAADAVSISGLSQILGQFRMNKIAAYTANPTDVSGVTKSGDAASVLEVVNDAAALAAAGLERWATSGAVFRLDNSAGTTTARMNFVGSTGNTNQHALSAYVRGGSGRIELEDTSASAGVFGASANYVRVGGPVSVNGTSRRLAVRADPGQVVYAILPQLEEGPAVTDVIVSEGARALVGSPFTAAISVETLGDYGATNIMTFMSINNGSNTARVDFERSAGGTARMSDNGGIIAGTSSTRAGARTLKGAGRVRGDASVRVSWDGTPFIGSTSVISTTFNRIDFGARSGGGSQILNGYVQRVQILGDTSDAQLQGLSVGPIS